MTPSLWKIVLTVEDMGIVSASLRGKFSGVDIEQAGKTGKWFGRFLFSSTRGTYVLPYE